MLMISNSKNSSSKSNKRTKLNSLLGLKKRLDMISQSTHCMTSKLKEFMSTRDNLWTSFTLFIDTLPSLTLLSMRERTNSFLESLWLVERLPLDITMLKLSLSWSRPYPKKSTVITKLEIFWRSFSCLTTTFQAPKSLFQLLSFPNIFLLQEQKHWYFKHEIRNEWWSHYWNYGWCQRWNCWRDRGRKHVHFRRESWWSQ